jgi:antitoxin component of MazEF toxin-antitoxin module
MDVEIRLKLRRIGNSMVISIPSQVVTDLKLKAGDNMLLDVQDAMITIRKETKTSTT